MGSLSASNLPVIDFSPENLKPGTSSWLSTCKSVLRALEDCGCFIATNNKVPPDLHNNLFSNALPELFNLPVETKKRNVSDIPFYGYIGHEGNLRPLFEGLAVGNAGTLEATQNFTKSLWPNGNDQFCEIVFAYSKLTSELDQMVMCMVCEAYGVPDHHNIHKDSTNYMFRMIKYSPPEKDGNNIGCGIHTDKSFLTILNQNQVNGLEIKTKDGKWIKAELSRSSFIVMAGEAILAWSNNRIHAPFHQVTMNGSQERYSVGLFAFRKGITEIPEKLIDEDHPLQFKPFDHLGLMHYLAKTKGPRTVLSAIKDYCGV